MTNKTALYDQHVKAGGKLVDFHGWMLPLHYGSQLEEHGQVRQAAGVFDVSHMTIVDLQGEQVIPFLKYLLANDVDKLKDNGKALYTAMLNDQGGILDDLIVYRLTPTYFRLVLNAATREKDLAWIEQHLNNYSLKLTIRDDLANLAVQGPKAREIVAKILPSSVTEEVLALKPFSCLLVDEWQIARTGYTGEDGFEILLPKTETEKFWNELLAAGVQPCGLGARDTLRLEAGLNLYGSDMDESVTPLESNIAWTIAFEPAERDFIGRKALEAQKTAADYPKLVGLLLADKGVLRAGQKVFQHEKEIGEIVSGSFSPSLKQSIAFARIAIKDNEDCQVMVRNKLLTAHLVKLPFVRNGKAVFKLMKEV